MQVLPLGRKDPLRRKWKPTPVFLPGESHGQRSLAIQSMGSQKVGHNWADLAHTRFLFSTAPFFFSFYYGILCKSCVVSLLPLYLWFSLESTLPHCLTHITLTRSVLTHDWQILWSLLFTANLTSVAFDTVDCLLPFGKLFLTWHLGQQTLEVLFLLIVHLTFFSWFLISNIDVLLSFTFINSLSASSLGYWTGVWNVTYPK